MLKLLVNVPPHVAGAKVKPEDLGGHAQELLDAGQAVEIEDEEPADPVDAALAEVFELEDQIDAAIFRRGRILIIADGLDEDDRAKVEAALAGASRVRPELFGLDEFPVSVIDFARDEGFDSIEILRDRARIGEALMDALPNGFVFADSPVEIVADLTRQLEDAAREIERRKAAFTTADERALTFEKQVLDLQDQLTAARSGQADNAVETAPPAEVATQTPPGKKSKA